MSGQPPPLTQQLHDGVLQSLAVARIRLDRALAQDGPLPRELGADLRALLDGEIAGLRRLIGGPALPAPPAPGPARADRADSYPADPAGPDPADPAGPAGRPDLSAPAQPDLPSALAATAAHLQSATGIRIRVDSRTAPPGRWAANDLVAYRILREALHNTAKHSGAAHAWVSVAARRDRLVCTVRDDGRGFAPPAARPHFGLAAMYAQARDAGGCLAVRSRRTGTCVTLELPAGPARQGGVQR